MLGIVSMCQFLPLLLLGLYAGAVADRFDRRRLTIVLQALMAAEALVFAVVDMANLATLRLVYLLTLVVGTFDAFSNPSRRTLATELVPEAQLANVVSLGTSVVTGSRIAGPAVAALLAARFGTAWVFLAVAVSHLAFLLALVRMDASKFHPIRPWSSLEDAGPGRTEGGLERAIPACRAGSPGGRVDLCLQLPGGPAATGCGSPDGG